MSGRDRLPRRFVEDGRGYVDARVLEDRRGHHPGIRVVDDRRGHPEIRVVDDRGGYPAVRVIEDRRVYPAIHERPVMRMAPRPHPTVMEEEIELHEVEFRRLMADRHALAEERLELHRELQAGKEEVRHLNMIIAEINGKKEAYIAELVDKRRKLEAELRANEPLRDEVVHLRGEIEKLLAVRKDLSAKAASIMQELNRDRSDTKQLRMLKAEIDGLQQDLTHTRNACESEQKVNFELVEQKKAMEKSMISMAQEIQQMRAELANLDGRPWGTGGSYGMKLGSPEAAFPTQYGDKYNIHAVEIFSWSFSSGGRYISIMRRKEQLLQENSKHGILIIVAFLMLKVLLQLTDTSRNELFIETKTSDCLDIPARAQDMDYHTSWRCEKWFIHQRDHWHLP